MNNRKWIKLQHAVSSLTFELPYICSVSQIKVKPAIPYLNKVPNWLGNWNNYYYEVCHHSL